MDDVITEWPEVRRQRANCASALHGSSRALAGLSRESGLRALLRSCAGLQLITC